MTRSLYSAFVLSLAACASAPAPTKGLELVLKNDGTEVARVKGTPAQEGDCQITSYSATIGAGPQTVNLLRTARVCGPNGQPSSLVEYVDVSATGATVARREQRIGKGVCYVQTRQPDSTYKTEVVGCSTLPKPSSKPVNFE